MFDTPNDTSIEGLENAFERDKTLNLENEESLEKGAEEEGEKKEDKKVDKSEVAQKIRYRDKYLKSQDKIRDLERRLEEKERKGESTASDEKELAAQKYIREMARKEYEAIKAEETARAEVALETLQDQLDDVMESTDFTENEILDICEEYEVEPKVAVKILNKMKEEKPKKPSLPQAKRGTSEVKVKSDDETKKTDKKKSLFDIAQEIKRELKSKS